MNVKTLTLIICFSLPWVFLCRKKRGGRAFKSFVSHRWRKNIVCKEKTNKLNSKKKNQWSSFNTFSSCWRYWPLKSCLLDRCCPLSCCSSWRCSSVGSKVSVLWLSLAASLVRPAAPKHTNRKVRKNRYYVYCLTLFQRVYFHKLFPYNDIKIIYFLASFVPDCFRVDTSGLCYVTFRLLRKQLQITSSFIIPANDAKTPYTLTESTQRSSSPPN